MQRTVPAIWLLVVVSRAAGPAVDRPYVIRHMALDLAKAHGWIAAELRESRPVGDSMQRIIDQCAAAALIATGLGCLPWISMTSVHYESGWRYRSSTKHRMPHSAGFGSASSIRCMGMVRQRISIFPGRTGSTLIPIQMSGRAGRPVNVFTLFAAMAYRTSNGRTMRKANRAVLMVRSVDGRLPECAPSSSVVHCALINPYGDTTFNESQVARLGAGTGRDRCA